MIRLMLILTLVFILLAFIWELRRYLRRDAKLEELKDTVIEGDIIDLEKEIATERGRQEDVFSEIKDINSRSNKHGRTKKDNQKEENENE